MIKIEFDNVKLSIPSCWEDIKLSDYEKWHLLKPSTNTEFVQYVADICNIDAKVLLYAPADVFNIIVDIIQPVLNENPKPSSSVEIDGVLFKVERSNKLTLGEWVDVESVIGSESENRISEILAIVCRPDDEAYNPDLFEERKELFKNLTCDKVLPLFAFFLSKKKRLEEILNRCLMVETQGNQLVKATETFVQDGDGIKRLPIWQRIKYIYLMKLLKNRLSKFSDSFATDLRNQMQRNNNTNF